MKSRNLILKILQCFMWNMFCGRVYFPSISRELELGIAGARVFVWQQTLWVLFNMPSSLQTINIYWIGCGFEPESGMQITPGEPFMKFDNGTHRKITASISIVSNRISFLKALEKQSTRILCSSS